LTFSRTNLFPCTNAEDSGEENRDDSGRIAASLTFNQIREE